MAQSLYRLSSRFIATTTKPGRYADGGKLYLSISPNGGRRWTFLYKWQGKPREMGLRIPEGCSARASPGEGGRSPSAYR